MCLQPRKHNFKIGYKNIQGLHNKNGCKIIECSNEFNCDIEIITETWGCNCEKLFKDYAIISETIPQKHDNIRKGRKSGGLIVLGKNSISKQVKVLKNSNNFIWLEVSKSIINNLQKNLLIVCTYIHDGTSNYHDPNVFEELSSDITKYCDHDTPLIITGDINARTGVQSDNFDDALPIEVSRIDTNMCSIPLPKRNNCDQVLNSHGRKILEICQAFNLSILNGRLMGDPCGLYTYHDINLGASTIDYSICSQNFYKCIKNFMVLPQNELSDHCKIITELIHSIPFHNPPVDNYEWVKINNKFKWDCTKSESFKNYLEQLEVEIGEIKQRHEAGLIESTGKYIQNIYIKAAKNILETKPIPNYSKFNKNSKKWFDKDCDVLKKQTRKIGREKHKEPGNIFLREKYREKLKEYKRTCTSKRSSFWQNKFDHIEKSLNDSKIFWKTWKDCSEKNGVNITPEISGEEWYVHFRNLHKDKSENLYHISTSQGNSDFSLNQPFTKSEFLTVVKNLKNGKSEGFDNVLNEMIKNSPNNILELLLEHINLCLEKSFVAQNLCYDIINPIFKSGDTSDPNNYRGICLSSSILKLITSLIFQRLLAKVNDLDLISKNQIGFKSNSRTSDHLLTLKTVIKKYVNVGKKKLYACFIDFRKAFDSVWHIALFDKLRTVGLHGKLLDLVENIYSKTKCAVKSNNKLTQFFNFTKGVRQGCPLSPLLFNLYINDIFHLIDSNAKTDITLNENKINAIMYADDLLIIADSQLKLQEHLNNLTEYCDAWKLEINTDKTKCMVFNQGNRLCNLELTINDKKIENVKYFKYLGFTIGAKNCSFVKTPIDLSIKAKRAIFSLNNKIKLSLLPVRLAIKVFNSQITPILLYGSEVWGPYLNYDFKSWDKCETEKISTQFLKRILGCAIQTPNLMVRSETGMRPLLCNIIRRSILYIKHIDQCNNSLANIAVDIEININDELNILSLIRKYTHFYQHFNYLSPISKYEIKKQVSNTYDEIWRQDISLLHKAESFLLFKTASKLETYTWMLHNRKHRIALSQLRLSCHPLMIEKGRHRKPKIPRLERVCPLCKCGVEDECHFVTTCPLFQEGRQKLFMVVEQNVKSFKQIPTNKQKYIYLQSNEDPTILAKLGEFVYNSFQLRKDILSK